MEKRDYLWDNMKAVLIFLVVWGHCLGLCSCHLPAAAFADRFIYCFHMPAFIFVSGFWAKRFVSDGKVKGEKAAVLLAYYLVFQIIFQVMVMIITPKSRFTLLNPSRGLWYLLAIFMYYLTVPLVKKLPPWLVVALSVVFSLMVGGDAKYLGNYLGVRRMITFAPFFYVGFYLSAEQIGKLRSMKYGLRLLISVSLTAATVVALMVKKNALTLNLFFAKSNYAKLHHTLFQGVVIRAAALALAAMMTLALLLILPSKKTFFSAAGKNSLQIFLLHMSIVVVLIHIKGFAPAVYTYPAFALTFLASLAVTALLSLNVFGYPFKWIRNGVLRLCGKAEGKWSEQSCVRLYKRGRLIIQRESPSVKKL
jgi:fucose 4-O-acetylase-like acetyltransferase